MEYGSPSPPSPPRLNMNQFISEETTRIMRDMQAKNPYYYTSPSITSGIGTFSTTSTLSTGAPKEKKMNAEVKVAQIKAGYVGQLWVAGKIAWESAPKKKYEKANNAAAFHLIEVFA